MVYDLTFMLTGPCDSRSRRVDVLSGERRTPTRIEMVVYRMRKILYLSRRFCSQELKKNINTTQHSHLHSPPTHVLLVCFSALNYTQCFNTAD